MKAKVIDELSPNAPRVPKVNYDRMIVNLGGIMHDIVIHSPEKIEFRACDGKDKIIFLRDLSMWCCKATKWDGAVQYESINRLQSAYCVLDEILKNEIPLMKRYES